MYEYMTEHNTSARARRRTFPCALSLDMVCDTGRRHRVPAGLAGPGTGGAGGAATALTTAAAFFRCGIFTAAAVSHRLEGDGDWRTAGNEDEDWDVDAALTANKAMQ
jgi:hypothetical protein